MSIKEFGRKAIDTVRDNTSTILTVASLFGLAGTVFFAFKASPKIKEAMDEREEDLKDLYSDALSEIEVKKRKKEINKTATKKIAKAAAPVAACVVVCAGGTIGAQIKNLNTITALSSAYALSEKKRLKFEEKTEEILGKNKKDKVNEEISKDVADETLKDTKIQITNTGLGNDIFIEKDSGQIFLCSQQALDKYEIAFNQELLEICASYYDTESSESYEQDACEIYKSIGLNIPEWAPYKTWSKGSLLKMYYTWTNKIINGEERHICVVEFGNARRDPIDKLAKDTSYIC